MVEFLKNPGSNSKPPPSEVKIKEEQKVVDSLCDLGLDRDRLQAILENVPSAVVVMEKPNGKVTYANKRAIELHGTNPCGLEMDEHPAKLKILTMDGRISPIEELHTYKALFYGQTTRNAPIVIERPDGKRFIVSVSAKPLYNKKGKISAAVAIFDDVTEYTKTQQALKESEERLNMAQRIAKLGSWEYYVKEDKAIWSDELFRIFGLTPQPHGPSLNAYLKLAHPEDRKKLTEHLLSMRKSDGVSSFDYRIVLSDGSVRTIHSERIAREVDREGNPIRIMGIEQDITERKKIEEKLEKYSANLEKLVEERTKQLRDAERLATIGQVAGMVGHDIRSPLQTITSELYLAKIELDKMPKTSQEEAVKESIVSIEKQASYIDKIVKDLQNYSQPLKPELVGADICSAVSEAVSTIEIPSNVQANTTCEVPHLKINVDLTFLRRIMVNLVTNAIQAMPNGGNLTVRVSCKEDRAVITVEDTGVGMSKEIQERIFTPLFTTKAKGQGFGLVSIKRMIEALGGTINFESEVGKGTKFIVELPSK